MAHLLKYKHDTCLVFERVGFFYREKLFAMDLSDFTSSLFINKTQFFHIYKIQ